MGKLGGNWGNLEKILGKMGKLGEKSGEVRKSRGGSEGVKRWGNGDLPP